MRAELYDAGSKLQYDPLAQIPGMDSGYFRALDFEYDWPQERVNEINAAIRETPLRGEFRPWPDPFPQRCWIDWTNRYEAEDGGLEIKTWQRDQLSGDFAPVPLQRSVITDPTDYNPYTDGEHARLNAEIAPEDVAAREANPTEWIRQKLYNEIGGKRGGQCDLKRPTVIEQLGHQGPDFRLSCNHSPLFAPFDLRHPEWYQVVGPDGEGAGVSTEDLVRMSETGQYRLYLRPANWRWVATVWANYYYVSWFEAFPTREVFTKAWFDRPPIYPTRHDLLHTTQNAYFEYLGTLYSIDSGIEDGFNSSRGAAQLRTWILDAQWWTLSEAYIFTRNDPATLVLWLYPPETNDIVLGIGRVDVPEGEESVLWLKQTRDLTDEFPRQVIGNYIILTFTAAD